MTALRKTESGLDVEAIVESIRESVHNARPTIYERPPPDENLIARYLRETLSPPPRPRKPRAKREATPEVDDEIGAMVLDALGDVRDMIREAMEEVRDMLHREVTDVVRAAIQEAFAAEVGEFQDAVRDDVWRDVEAMRDELAA